MYCFSFRPSFTLFHRRKAQRTEGNKSRGGAVPPQVLETTFDRMEQTSTNCELRREQMPVYLLEETKYPAGQEASSVTDRYSMKS